MTNAYEDRRLRGIDSKRKLRPPVLSINSYATNADMIRHLRKGGMSRRTLIDKYGDDAVNYALGGVKPSGETE